jgi:hypothetical protein
MVKNTLSQTIFFFFFVFLPSRFTPIKITNLPISLPCNDADEQNFSSFVGNFFEEYYEKRKLRKLQYFSKITEKRPYSSF